jgi:enterochelin esterase family protein
MKTNIILFILVSLSVQTINIPLSGQEVNGINKEVSIARVEGSGVDLFARSLGSLPIADRDALVQQFLIRHPVTPVVESDSIGSIYYYGRAQQVLINGDLQKGWSSPDTLAYVPCGEKSFFHISYLLPSDARVDYQLIVDSAYMTDPANPVITPSGYGPHSQLAMPGFVPDPARAYYPDVPRGIIDSLFFTSQDRKILPRKIKVYLPAGYDTLSKVPVLYVMDGLEAFDWMDYANVLDNLIAWQRIKPAIAVFIPPGDRGGEFMGRDFNRFLESLCDEMVPWIDTTYRTDKQPSGRGITGISAGGYFALMTVLSRSDVFGCGAGQSSAIGLETYKALHDLVDKGKYHQGLRIYFDVGRYDLAYGLMKGETFLRTNENFSREMTRLNVDHRFQVLNDGHEWANWRERTDDILEYFFP